MDILLLSMQQFAHEEIAEGNWSESPHILMGVQAKTFFIESKCPHSEMKIYKIISIADLVL